MSGFAFSWIGSWHEPKTVARELVYVAADTLTHVQRAAGGIQYDYPTNTLEQASVLAETRHQTTARL
jgi:hypothetical protein